MLEQMPSIVQNHVWAAGANMSLKFSILTVRATLLWLDVFWSGMAWRPCHTCLSGQSSGGIKNALRSAWGILRVATYIAQLHAW